MGCSYTKPTKHSIIKSSSSNRLTPQLSPKKNAIRASTFVFHKKQNIAQDYELGPILGEGAFGSVRIAVHKLSGLDRAVKTIKKERITKDFKLKSQFFAEIDILKQLDHPNVLRIFEFYEDARFFHLVTELVHGGELFEYLTSSQTLSELVAMGFMKQLLLAVNYCHKQGIVHRDLKPENLLLDCKSSEATLKLIDFGSSTIYTGAPLTARVGTAYYIAPEVLTRSYSEKCDIWSCGVILFLMLSGRPPFSGNNDSDIFKKIEKGVFSTNTHEWQVVSNEAKDLVKHLLEYDQNLRLSAEEALTHPWFHSGLNETSQPSPAVISSLAQFRASQKLQHAALTFISSQLVSKKELAGLAESFKAIDKDGDGKLSREELFVEFAKGMSEEEAAEEVERVMGMVDLDKNGFLDYSEFLMASIKKETIMSKKNLEAAFRLFDKKGLGTIGVEEIRGVLGEEVEQGTVWEEVIRKVDKNGDGCIDLKEFKDMMMEIFNV